MGAKGLIDPPPRGTAMESLITLAVVVFFATYLALHRSAPGWLLAGFSLLTFIAICMRAVHPFLISLLCTLWVVLPVLLPFLTRWPLYKTTPLVVFAIVVATVPKLRASVLWMRPGRLGADILLLVLVLMLFSNAALIVWDVVCKPDLGPSRANIPTMPLWVLPLAGLAFALINAAVEEAIFRGILLQALDSAIGMGVISVVIQAVLFGWMHYSEVGCPKGLLGVAMASVYGLMLGFLRNHARGMLAPLVAHVGTDVTVLVMVATS